MRRMPSTVVTPLAGLLVLLTIAGCGGSAGSYNGSGSSPGTQQVDQQYSPPAGRSGAAGRRPAPAPRAVPGGILAGVITAPGGPFLRDRYGRVVMLHGVNAVEKNPPYELTVSPGNPWSFTAADARAISWLGFNVVRLGILWEGLEPGTGGPNDPAICAPGTPSDPHMYDKVVVRSYLQRVAGVVHLLGRFHVYTLLDMHQDVYSQSFRGEGAPAWAVCSGSNPLVPVPGRWSANYRSPALDEAVAHFWTNDVVGDLQGQYDEVWGAVARYFASNPWILGYDPYNEPFEREVTVEDTQVFATLLECFYTGRAHAGRLDSDSTPISCPRNDPRQGVIPTIEAADPHHLVFVEPDIYSIHGRPNLLGPMSFPRLVLNFHTYCGARSPVTGDPTNVDACTDQILNAMLRRQNERSLMASRRQPGGPPWFLSEFGATTSAPFLDGVTHAADLLQLGWTYWAWKYYSDPTGSADEALAGADGQLAPSAAVLSRAYAQAVAGTPVTTSFDPESGTFSLVYVASSTTAPTVIFLPVSMHYPTGYCSRVVGGSVSSAPGSSHLLVHNAPGAREVDVTVVRGVCSSHK